MPGRFLISLAAGVAAVLVAASACAQSAPSAEPRVALVIGNSSYKVDPLKNPVNDADDMAQALRSLGFRVIALKDATQRQMITAVNEFGMALKKGGVGLFYFAGHGVQSRGRNFLVPVGANIDSEAELEFETLDANRVLALMEEAGNRVNLVILDACRNNPFARSFRSASRGLAQMEAAKGSFVAFATAPGSVAADGTGRNGLYTQHLLASLRHPDSDIDKVFRRVTGEVSRATGGRQVPWISSSLTADFYFRPGAQPGVAPPAADPAALELAFWESIRTSGNRADFEEYLRQYPDGGFSGLARNRLQSAGPVPATQVATIAPSAPAPAPPAIQDDLRRLAAGTTFKDCDACPDMVVVPPGIYLMGAVNITENERPPHNVAIQNSFAVGKFEVTFDQWDACVKEGACSHLPDDRGWGRGSRPVVNVSWSDAREYVHWLSRKTGRNYRLLTEAEWEYAARGGSTTAYYWGDSDADICQYASVIKGGGGCGSNQPSPVGSRRPNAFGLYDMLGNVWEWVEDCLNKGFAGAPTDGSAWVSGDCAQRMRRGGSWDYDPPNVRSAIRTAAPASYRSAFGGLRVARTR